ncbi:hypothetical protein C0991_009069, partial [Blastosporella zonata]
IGIVRLIAGSKYGLSIFRGPGRYMRHDLTTAWQKMTQDRHIKISLISLVKIISSNSHLASTRRSSPAWNVSMSYFHPFYHPAMIREAAHSGFYPICSSQDNGEETYRFPFSIIKRHTMIKDDKDLKPKSAFNFTFLAAGLQKCSRKPETAHLDSNLGSFTLPFQFPMNFKSTLFKLLAMAIATVSVNGETHVVHFANK